MKIRTGFVSNSSSSSYIIKVYANFDDILRNLSFWFIDKNAIIIETKKEIKRLKNLLKTKHNKFYDIFKRENKKELKELNERLKFLESNTDNIDFLKNYFSWNGIWFEDKNKYVKICYDTTMHNDFVSGMSDLYKEIVLSLTFDSKYKIEYERNDNSL
jgi:hypothetical protein